MKSSFCSGNLLEIDNAYLDNAAEAKEHYINAVEAVIEELEETKAEILEIEIHD